MRSFFKYSLSSCIVFALLLTNNLQAQYGPRLFLDGPGVYFAAPDVAKIGNNLGLGSQLSMNVASHNAVIRLGGGSTFTVDAQGQDLLKSLLITPYFLLEAGAGKYRSNGNKCAKTHRPAFTAMAKGGVRYNLLTAKNRPEGSPSSELDYALGAEFGYFYIRDVIRNTEVFSSVNYFMKSKNIAAEIGIRTFFNLRGRRD